MTDPLDLLEANVEERILLESMKSLRDGAWRERVRTLLDAADEPRLWDAARENRIIPLVAHAATDAGVTLPERWEAEHQEWVDRLGAYMDELDRVAALFARHDIPLVALKNGGIARALYPCPGCCPMGDLDVMVLPDDFRRAHRLLVEDGYTLRFRSDLKKAEVEEAERDGGGEYLKEIAPGRELWFELQWRPVAGRWMTPEREPDPEELMARSVPVDGSDVRILSPEDNLLQVSLHTAKHSWVRPPGPRLHTDVERIVRAQDVDWDVFCDRVEELRVRTPVYVSLAMAADLLGTPIPDAVLQRVAPSAVKRNAVLSRIRRAGVLYPDRPKFKNFDFILFTALLYDDLPALIRTALPRRDWMEERYGERQTWRMPALYARHLLGLVFRRELR